MKYKNCTTNIHKLTLPPSVCCILPVCQLSLSLSQVLDQLLCYHEFIVLGLQQLMQCRLIPIHIHLWWYGVGKDVHKYLGGVAGTGGFINTTKTVSSVLWHAICTFQDIHGQGKLNAL